MAHRHPSHFRLSPSQYRLIPGTNYGTPKELWGFRIAAGRGKPIDVARTVLEANEDILGLEEFPIRRRHVIPSAGGWHVIFDQHYLGARIHRAYVTVHMNRDRDIYLLKNRAVPASLLREHGKDGVAAKSWPINRARDVARRSAERQGASAVPLGQPERVWFPVRSRLRPAFKFRFRTRPSRHEWIIYVDAETFTILSRYDNLSQANGRARIFNPNPVVALGDWRPLLVRGKPVRRVPPSAYEAAVLRDVAKSGLLSGPRVTTDLTTHRLRRRDYDFTMASDQPGFEEVMAYCHIDRAVRYLEHLGYRGSRRVFKKPLHVNARATREDQSLYSPGDKSLAFGTGKVDDAEDGETILHEFGHALQDAICPDFGQSHESAAMGEGFGDYFAASFFAGKKSGAAKALLPAVMTWDGIVFPDPDPQCPPCVRRVDSKLTMESFNHSPSANEHLNGQIWSAALWDIWKAIGRDCADRVIIESHFQLDGFTTFARGARAILDADQNLFGGEHRVVLRRVFHRRGIGPVE